MKDTDLTEIEKTFLTLVKEALHPAMAPTQNPLPTGEADKAELFRLAEIHFVTPMVYEALSRRKDFAEWTTAERGKWRQAALPSFVVQSKRTQSFLHLYQEMTDSGLALPLVVKGIILRNMYPNPDMRKSSDEDLLVRPVDFPALDAFLLAHGFQRPPFDTEETPFEVAYLRREDLLYLEVHTTLFSEKSEAYGHLNREFDRIHERATSYSIQGVEVKTPDDTDHFLYLLCHCYKHFLHGGFGIRQLCDVLVMTQTAQTRIDWQHIADRTTKLHMFILWRCFADIGEKFLGFEKKALPGLDLSRPLPDSTELLSDTIAAGVYGKEGFGRIHSGNMVMAGLVQSRDQKSGKWRLVSSSLFPKAEYMKKSYAYADKRPFLLPVAYVQRLGAYRKLRRKAKLQGGDDDSVTVAKKRIAMLEKYGMVE